MNSYLIVTFILLAYTQAKVTFQLTPNHSVINQTSGGNGTTFKNYNTLINFGCYASTPTHWIYDDDPDIMGNQKSLHLEHTSRDPDTFVYSAHISIYFYYRKMSVDSFICSEVQDPQSYLLIQLLPTGEDTLQVLVLERKDTLTPPRIEPSCHFTFVFMYIENHGYFVSCVGRLANRPVLKYSTCRSSPVCANTYRHLKAMRNACSTTVVSDNYKIDSITEGWKPIQEHYQKYAFPGIAVCSDGAMRGGQEYFFTGPNNLTGKREIRFSWNETTADEMIWITPSHFPNVDYTGRYIEGTCNIPMYGFSQWPTSVEFITKLNDSILSTDHNFDVNKNDWIYSKVFQVQFKSPGTYEIICKGLIWNSTEWARKSHTITVEAQIPPYFDHPSVNITMVVGETRKYTCEGKGNPPTKVDWILPVPVSDSVQVNGSTLVLYNVSKNAEGVYSCRATNELDQSAYQTTNIRITDDSPFQTTNISITDDSRFQTTTISITDDAPEDIPKSPPTNFEVTPAVWVSTCIIILLLAGFVYLYYRFKILHQMVSWLTNQEIKEFREGSKKPVVDSESPVEFVASLAYDMKVELPRSCIQIDASHTLGSGEFGVVYRGKVRTGQELVDAAFKTIKKGANASHMKALLAELKILIYLGHHENIVKLIGACTKNLSNGEVFVVVELCNCSLLDFLRRNASQFVNCVTNNVLGPEPIPFNTPEYSCVNGLRQFSTYSLIRWSVEVATGLEFVARKRIVHGDIAARNILLTSQLNAKICDFGLARQLVDYQYIKSEQCPLPWKWMAIESLRQMQFSTKSDIWAFGVTLWEIFTLGDIPYLGLTWSMDFVNELHNGKRLSNHPNFPNEIWLVVTECWHENPNERISFSSAKLCLEKFDKGFME